MSFNTKEQSVLDSKVVADLQLCESEDDLKKIFSDHAIDNPRDKSLYLKAAMNETESYYASSTENISDDDLYRDDVVIFLNGAWRFFSS